MRLRALSWLLLLALPTVAYAETLPIFDAHIHYSRPDWDALSPERVLTILRDANVRRAIVSSTPDDGTLKLYEKAPAVVVPFLRPYRSRDDMVSWAGDPAIAAYVEERLKRGVYKGVGEFHLSAGDADAPVVKRVAELAGQHNLFLQAHVDDVTVEKLLTLYPRVRILWAHAGMSASAATVGRLLDRFPTLWIELSLRSDVAPGGALDPDWRALFLRHPDRFMVGTDTWVTSRWESLVEGMRDVQRWLAQLPPEVAEKIAYRNGDRLFPPP
jgi:predicted TIM-barrel fold metal-dependent hydrolase